MWNKKLLTSAAYLVAVVVGIGIFMSVDGNMTHHAKPGPNTLNTDSEITRFKMDRVKLGNSGLSLSSPIAFTSIASEQSKNTVSALEDIDVLTTESFKYERNGVIINVDYITYAQDSELSIPKIRQQYEQDLVQLKKDQAVTYSLDEIQRSGIEGLLINAEYPGPHFDKTQRFEVLTFIKLNRVWRVTAKYKGCDRKGQAMVQWMLESIRIVT